MPQIFLFQLPPKQIEVATEESVNLKGMLLLPIHEVYTSLAILNLKIFLVSVAKKTEVTLLHYCKICRGLNMDNILSLLMR